MTLLNKLLGRPGTGWIPQPEDKRDLKFLGFGDYPIQIHADRSLRNITRVYDQKDSNSCVANAIATALTIYYGELFARLFLYYYSRRQSSTRKSLIDSGTTIRDAAKAYKLLGLPIEKFWPFVLSKVNDVPSLVAHLKAYGVGRSYRFIQGDRERRVKLICDAVYQGSPVVFGTEIDKDFFKNGGLEVTHKTGRTVGRHAMTIIGYHNKGESFEVANSWGTNWGDKGFCVLGVNYICADYSQDFCVIER
jgi:hypothetical protein